MEYFTTSFNPSGNRWIDSCGGPNVTRSMQPIVYSEIYPTSQIKWIVGNNQGLDFLAVAASNAAYQISFDDGTISSLLNTTFADAMLSTRPPAVYAVGDDKEEGNILKPIVPPCPPCPSIYSSTVPTPDGGFLFVDQNHQLMQVDSSGNNVTLAEISSIEEPLKDAHIVYSKQYQRWAVYTGATLSRYTHGILGDFAEGYRLYILKWNASSGLVEIDTLVELEGNDLVFEGLSPLWADIDGDGMDDLLTTVSKSGEGSQLRAYLLNFDIENGVEQLVVKGTAPSAYIGRGLRWRHQMAVGPFGPNGEIEVVETQTPHIGGIVQFHRYDAACSQLVLVASTESYTSHAIDSRNVDMAVVADFNGDGIPELLIQNQAKSQLVALQRFGDEVVRVWEVDMPNRLESNLGGVGCVGGRMELLLSTRSNRLMRLSFPLANETVGSTTMKGSNSSGAPNLTSSTYTWLWPSVMCVLWFAKQFAL